MSSEYTPLVSWETKLLDVLPVLAEPFHYICKVASVNPNDYAPNTIGIDRFYIVDYTGKIYQITEIVDAPTQTIKIYDLTEDTDEGPYLSENAFVYQTRNGINVLTQAQRKRLHPTAIDQIMNIENNIIGGNYFWDKAWGAARIYGGIVTSNGDGTVAISAGKGFIKASDDVIEKVPTSDVDAPISTNSYVEWNDVASLALTDEAYNFVYYDGVDGIMKATTDFYAISFYQDFTVGRVYRSGTTVTIRLCGTNVWNFNRRVQLFGEERFPVERARGMMIGNPSGLYISLTGGILWAELINRFSVNAFDSSGTDRFLRWYRNGSGGWTTVTNQSVIDNINYDNNSGTLAALTSNRYGVHWVYVVHDSSVHVVYGQGNYTLTQATTSTPPASIPGLLAAYGTLVGKIIVQKSSAAFYSVESPFTTRFNSSGVTDHSELSGLTTGDAGHTNLALLSGRLGDVQKIDQIDEFTPAAGVTIDGVLIKDSEIGFTYLDKYTNLTPMPEDVGGAEEGTTFNEVSIDQVLTTILYPYQYPAFKTFTIQSQTTPLEVGASIAANRVFTWTTNLVGDANINAGSIVIRDVTGNANIATGLSYTNTPYTSTYGAITKTTATTNQFSITGTNSKSETFNKTYTVTWYWRIYWGTSANTSLTEAQIKLLANNALVSSAIGTKTFAAGDYKYFCIPAAPVFTAPVSFKDSAGFEVAMTKLTDVNITNTHLQALDYAVYRTSYPQVSALTITIS